MRSRPHPRPRPGHHARGPVVLAVRSVIPRRRGAPRRTRDRGSTTSRCTGGCSGSPRSSPRRPGLAGMSSGIGGTSMRTKLVPLGRSQCLRRALGSHSARAKCPPICRTVCASGAVGPRGTSKGGFAPTTKAEMGSVRKAWRSRKPNVVRPLNRYEKRSQPESSQC
jgi:hypothetical protein